MAANKQMFYENINQDTIFDEDFFRKVLGYSMYDKSFMEAVAAKLVSLCRADAVQAYNAWYSVWKAEDDQMMKSIGEQYQKSWIFS